MDLFDLFAKITLDTGEYEDGLKDAERKTSKFADTLKNGLATAAKIGAAAIGTAATGISALVKSSVDAYANYEQLVGGVETLFKTSSDKVMEYAANAYETAGMSANEYMETVTSFSASLLQSLDGDTAAAAEKANLAITDMSDNANKMGTSMEMIQNAYNGFAKQNYTMLDNLKLGYGGTKEEMQRLLDDAEKLSGQKFDLSSYGDIVDAIHVVQTEMGITGTTAKEASTTISGSFGAAKAAWENLVTGIADKDADLSGLIDNFIEKVTVAAGNVMPVAEKALDGAARLIEGLLPIIAKTLPTVISDVLPDLMDAAISFVSTLGAGISENLEPLMDSAFEVINSLVNFIIENAPALLEAAVTIMTTLVSGIAEQLPTLIPAAVQLILDLTAALVDNVDQIVDASVALIDGLTKGIINSLPILLEQMPVIIGKITKAFIEAFPDLVIAVVEAVANMHLAVVDMFPEMIDAVAATIGEIGMAIADGADDWNEKFEDFGSRFYDWQQDFSQKLKEAWDKIIDNVTEFLTPAFDLGRQFMEKLIDGIVNGVTNIKEKLSEGISKITDGVKDFFGGLFGDTSVNLNFSANTRSAEGGSAYSNGKNIIINQSNTFGTNQTLADQEKANQRLAAALAK